MGSEYDEVAKAIATNVPRRRVLKLLAGGVVASIATAVTGAATAAKPRSASTNVFQGGSCSQSLGDANISVNYNPGVNCDVEELLPRQFIPWWSADYPGNNGRRGHSSFPIGINGSSPD